MEGRGGVKGVLACSSGIECKNKCIRRIRFTFCIKCCISAGKVLGWAVNSSILLFFLSSAKSNMSSYP